MRRLIVIDPPWPEVGGGKVKRGADRHYPVLDVRDIPATILRARHADGSLVYDPNPEGCHVWLWTTSTYLPAAFDVLKAIGARYVTHRAWVKAKSVLGHECYQLDQIGMGQYVRGGHELALLGVIGTLPPAVRNLRSVCMASRREHSRKPERFYSEVRELAGLTEDECGVEIFAADHRPGYVGWGWGHVRHDGELELKPGWSRVEYQSRIVMYCRNDDDDREWSFVVGDLDGDSEGNYIVCPGGGAPLCNPVTGREFLYQTLPEAHAALIAAGSDTPFIQKA